VQQDKQAGGLAGMEPVQTLESGSSKNRLYFLKQSIETDSYMIISTYPSSEDYLDSLKKRTVAILTDQEVDIDLFKVIREYVTSFTKSAREDARESDYTLVRIFISFLFGLFMFFFAAYVIRDPIPVLDEIAIAFAGGIIFYFVIKRMNLFAISFSKSEEEFMKLLDSIQVMQSQPMGRLTVLYEKYLRTFIGMEIDPDRGSELLKEELRGMDLGDLARYRQLTAGLSRKYRYRKIRPGSSAFLAMMQKSALHQATFIFYYQLYEALFP
jgi:hypothetical protein